MILAGDIGGTKTNLAFVETQGTQLMLRVYRSYPSREYKSLGEVLREFLTEYPTTITSAAFGIAGPVVNGSSKLTNLGWDVDAQEVATQLGLKSVGLINDLEATGYGALRIPKEDKTVLNEGVRRERGSIAVIAAGTGLGEGGLVWNGRRYQAIPSEGGHTDFGPHNETEYELLKFLSARFGRASYERIVSGPGIVNVYEFFRARSAKPEPGWLSERLKTSDAAAVISQVAIDGSDETCAQAMNLVISVYGAEAGNLALKFLATGGVLVGGGIAPRIIRALQTGSFLESFCFKGRYTNLLKQMPVEVIVNDKAALFGAAHYAGVMHD